jgi:hypothetical protein
MSRIIRLYPAAWRERYEAEFLSLLDERPPTLLDRLDIVRGAVDARIHPQVGPGAREPESGAAKMRGAGATAVLGGVFWALAGLGFYGAPYVDDLGYKDSGAIVLLGAAAAALTGLGAVMMLRRTASRSIPLWGSAAAILLGAIGLALPWPILLLGYFGIVSGTLVFGMVGAARFGPTYVFVGLGGLLALGFNTEDGRALMLLPLGAAWIVAGALTARGSVPLTPHVPAVVPVNTRVEAPTGPAAGE